MVRVNCLSMMLQNNNKEGTCDEKNGNENAYIFSLQLNRLNLALFIAGY
jgi:hypothetical protein